MLPEFHNLSDDEGDMSEQQQTIKTGEARQRSRCFQEISIKDTITIVSSLLVPVVLGVFTILSSYNQQGETARQKERDETLQRQQWQIESERNELQIQMSQDKYRNDLLVAYIKEMGELLERNDYSLTHNIKIAALARAKTLNTILQLDASRNTRVLRFLYETMLLTSRNMSETLDISTAKLINVDKMILTTNARVGPLSLIGTVLLNCSFNYTSIKDVDFSLAQMNDINFSHSSLERANFSSTQLENIEGVSIYLKDVDFISANLKYANFSSSHSDYTDHSITPTTDMDRSAAIIINVNFTSVKLQNVDILFTKLQDTHFGNGQLQHVCFSNARLHQINFVSATLVDVDFSFSELTSVNFSFSRLQNANFSSSVLREVTFSSSTMVNADFSSAILHNVIFKNVVAQKVRFTRAVLGKLKIYFCM